MIVKRKDFMQFYTKNKIQKALICEIFLENRGSDIPYREWKS